ncbi:MAG TPA: ribosomal protein S18-alanine N-acetyltransferase [Gallionella sp.]
MLRAMTPDDVDAVLAIEKAVQAYPWSRGNFADALGSGYLCSVDEQDGEIRAYAILMPLPDEAELLNIGVAEAHQRKGLGRAMLVGMLDAARRKGMRCVFLEVRATNAPALALYRSAGFLQIGLRRDYYRSGDGAEDAVTMACGLTGGENG